MTRWWPKWSASAEVAYRRQGPRRADRRVRRRECYLVRGPPGPRRTMVGLGTGDAVVDPLPTIAVIDIGSNTIRMVEYRGHRPFGSPGGPGGEGGPAARPRPRPGRRTDPGSARGGCSGCPTVGHWTPPESTPPYHRGRHERGPGRHQPRRVRRTGRSGRLGPTPHPLGSPRGPVWKAGSGPGVAAPPGRRRRPGRRIHAGGLRSARRGGRVVLPAPRYGSAHGPVPGPRSSPGTGGGRSPRSGGTGARATAEGAGARPSLPRGRDRPGPGPGLDGAHRLPASVDPRLPAQIEGPEGALVGAPLHARRSPPGGPRSRSDPGRRDPRRHRDDPGDRRTVRRRRHDRLCPRDPGRDRLRGRAGSPRLRPWTS